MARLVLVAQRHDRREITWRVFIPVANVVMGAVPAADQGMASGTNNAIRELGGVLGIAVLATVFASHGSYVSPATFADGLRPATGGKWGIGE